MRTWTDEMIKEYLDTMYGQFSGCQLKAPQIAQFKKARPVLGTFPDGSMRMFKSMSEAHLVTGANIGAISECCSHGRSKSAKGIKWRYA